MKKIILIVLILPLVISAQGGSNELVNPKDLIPDIVIDLRYSTPNHKFLSIPDVGDMDLPKFYTANECLMVLKLAEALKSAQDTLRTIRTHSGKDYPGGIGIKIWDGYRPRAIQYLFWEIFPNSVYIADPSGGSMHNRGGAVDMTLVDLATGEELAMPTKFDDFSTTASHNYNDLSAEVKDNRELLKTVMTNIAGLKIYSAEWWHYNLSEAGSYPLQDFQMK